MAGKAMGTQPAAAFEYELFEDDIDHLTTVVATPNKVDPWINPARLKLRHRIGRGLFGDVWLATQNLSTEDHEEYQEVAIKMLHPIKEEHKKDLLNKFDDFFFKCRGLEGVCWLNGISVIDRKICVIMKFYDGSVGEKMARLKGGKLLLPDVLRYGIDLAQGIMELHSKEILVLNLKPSNYLLKDTDQAMLGDFGIPFLLVGVQDMASRPGTPNYMAPEQWEPDVRGPLSFETDSWGFGCSILEMLSGVQPWSGKSADEIYQLVVEKHEKPLIPGSLPPAVENVILGCFAYDFRSRPLMADILRAFKSSENALNTNDDIAIAAYKSSHINYTEWFLSKDRLQVGDTVRSRKSLNSCKPENMDIPEGIVVGLEHNRDQLDFLLVRVHGIHNPLKRRASTLERVTNGFSTGDWVRLKHGNNVQSPIGTLHFITRDGNVTVGFIGLHTLWKGNFSELQMAESFFVGQFVRLKANVVIPKFKWPSKNGEKWATGRISWILPNGCLVVNFPSRVSGFGVGKKHGSFLADPAQVELVSFNNCHGMVEKYQHLEDFHWAVTPLVIALGLFTAIKFGFLLRKKLGRSRRLRRV